MFTTLYWHFSKFHTFWIHAINLLNTYSCIDIWFHRGSFKVNFWPQVHQPYHSWLIYFNFWFAALHTAIYGVWFCVCSQLCCNNMFCVEFYLQNGEIWCVVFSSSAISIFFFSKFYSMYNCFIYLWNNIIIFQAKPSYDTDNISITK